MALNGDDLGQLIYNDSGYAAMDIEAAEKAKILAYWKTISNTILNYIKANADVTVDPDTVNIPIGGVIVQVDPATHIGASTAPSVPTGTFSRNGNAIN